MSFDLFFNIVFAVFSGFATSALFVLMPSMETKPKNEERLQLALFFGCWLVITVGMFLSLTSTK